MDVVTNLKKLKEQAEASSFKKLQNIFNSTDQFEQVQQIILRTDKKKVI